MIFVRALAAILFLSTAATAQTYPTKPVRYIIPSTGGTEVIARLIAEGMSRSFGQQVLVDPRTGAAGNLGTEIAAKAPADGYTVLQITQSHTLNASLFKKLSYDLVRDFAPVTRTDSAPMLVVVHPSFPAKTILDLVRIAKAKPRTVMYASAGTGTSTYLAAELFKMAADVDLVEVPYRSGAPSLTAVVAGEVPVYFAPIATGLPFVEQGKLRLLAAATSARLPSLPDVPTVAESGYPGFEASNWHGLVVPAKTPAPIVAAIREAAMTGLAQPDIAKRVVGLGYTIIRDTPAEFAEFIKADIEKWRKLVQQKGLTAE